VWSPREYEKLRQYDNAPASQSPRMFLCHDGDRLTTLCRGWLDTHDARRLYALRLGAEMGLVDESVFDLPPSPVPVFESGSKAADHGLRDIQSPGSAAIGLARKLLSKHPELKRKPPRAARTAAAIRSRH